MNEPKYKEGVRQQNLYPNHGPGPCARACAGSVCADEVIMGMLGDKHGLAKKVAVALGTEPSRTPFYFVDQMDFSVVKKHLV